MKIALLALAVAVTVLVSVDSNPVDKESLKAEVMFLLNDVYNGTDLVFSKEDIDFLTDELRFFNDKSADTSTSDDEWMKILVETDKKFKAIVDKSKRNKQVQRTRRSADDDDDENSEDEPSHAFHSVDNEQNNRERRSASFKKVLSLPKNPKYSTIHKNPKYSTIHKNPKNSTLHKSTITMKPIMVLNPKILSATLLASSTAIRSKHG